MPSPFPGMDPFLESAEYFPSLHTGLIFCLQEAFQALLPIPYYAISGQRVWIEAGERLVEPDVEVMRPRVPREAPEPTGGGVAVAAPPSVEPVVVHVPREEHRQPYLEIYRRHGERDRLVTALEVLSMSNKTPGKPGFDLYRQKQREVLASRANLVEIDLLRDGEHSTAVPRDRAVAVAGEFDYHVCIHRFDLPEDYLVYPILLQQRLPRIGIPLLLEDGEVSVDLQPVFERCYAAGPYRGLIRYGEEHPIPPLRPEQWGITLDLQICLRPIFLHTC